MLDCSIIILTFNEEKNLPACLQSVQPLNMPIYVVDSFSTDSTLDIAKAYGCVVVQHAFENYAAQRNWALQNLPIQTNWVLHLDADHRITPELQRKLKHIFDNSIDPKTNGFLVSRRTIFLGKWIRYGGHYPTYHAILFRLGKGHCEPKKYDQHFVVEGKVQILKEDIIDIITESLDTFTARHNHWSSLEAREVVFASGQVKTGLIQPSIHGDPIQKRRFLKTTYYRFPIFIRPFVYFIIRYFIRLGFLDGSRGLIFHFLQGFWFRFLVDAKIYELKYNIKRADKHFNIL